MLSFMLYRLHLPIVLILKSFSNVYLIMGLKNHFHNTHFMTRWLIPGQIRIKPRLFISSTYSNKLKFGTTFATHYQCLLGTFNK
jgi:hypothetical protein